MLCRHNTEPTTGRAACQSVHLKKGRSNNDDGGRGAASIRVSPLKLNVDAHNDPFLADYCSSEREQKNLSETCDVVLSVSLVLTDCPDFLVKPTV